MNSCTCIFCGKSFESFADHGADMPVFKKYNVIGGGYRKNARCPECNSIDRDRLVYFYLTEKLDILVNNYTMLHCAPEVKIFNELKRRENLTYITCDISSALAYVHTDLVSLPFSDNRFDIIVCNHVLEHIIDDHAAMCELYRILKPGGSAILQVPISRSLEHTFEDDSVISEQLREEIFGQKDHVRIYGEDYVTRLEKAGFLPLIFDFEKEYGKKQRIRCGIAEHELVYHVKK